MGKPGLAAGRRKCPHTLLAAALVLVIGFAIVPLRNKDSVSTQLAIGLACFNGMGNSSASSQPSIPKAAAGKPWPGTVPMQIPTKETYDKVQGDPTLTERKPDVLREFEAAPWLLPPRTKALKYAGVHKLDELLSLRSIPQGNYNKTITLMTFTVTFAMLTQNTIYSMVKFGGVRNYIVATSTQRDLEACADLNLPCADVSEFLPEPLEAPESDSPAVFGTHDYLVITWLGPYVIQHLLKEGYVVHNTDSDVVYTLKPVWESYISFIEHGQVDAAFQAEYGSVNTGNFVILPTPNVLHLFETWTGMSAKLIKDGHHDQQGLDALVDRGWQRCTGSKPCLAARERLNETKQVIPLFRVFQPGYYPYIDDLCTLSRPETAPLLDTCDWSILFVHPLCTIYPGKLAIFKQQEIWFLDNDRCLPSGDSKVFACQLLRWQEPDVERHLYSCPSYGLGLQHERESTPRRNVTVENGKPAGVTPGTEFKQEAVSETEAAHEDGKVAATQEPEKAQEAQAAEVPVDSGDDSAAKKASNEPQAEAPAAAKEGQQAQQQRRRLAEMWQAKDGSGHSVD